MSRIRDNSNKTLAEFIRLDEVVTLHVGGIDLTIYMNLKVPELSTTSTLTEQDEVKLSAFMRGNSADAIRRFITLLIRSEIPRGKLKGFVTIAELVGKQPLAEFSGEVKRTRLGPVNTASKELRFVLASTSSNMATSIFSGVKTSDCGIAPAADETCYCCGVGCACFCYLPACAAHDVCVDNYGYMACMVEFAAAVAAMHNAPFLCGGVV